MQLVFTFFESLPKDMLINLKEREREREKERNMDWLPLIRAPTRDQTRNPGVCPDWESNLQLFGAQGDAPTS